MSTRLLKDAIRGAALARRAGIDPGRRAAFAAALAGHGLAAVDTARADVIPVVAAFLPIRHEPDTRPLLSALAAAGIRTALPVTPPRGEPLRFRVWRGGEALAAGRFGTVEPTAAAAEAEPDLLFVPLAAFDRRGFRLGYGAGYYDGAIARLRRVKRVLAVGVAFAVQEVGSVPVEAHDQRLDALITEDGLTMFGPD